MKIKISAGAERDIADGCDFYKEIDPSLAMYFNDNISADIDSLILYAGVHAKDPSANNLPDSGFIPWQYLIIPITMECISLNA